VPSRWRRRSSASSAGANAGRCCRRDLVWGGGWGGRWGGGGGGGWLARVSLQVYSRERKKGLPRQPTAVNSTRKGEGVQSSWFGCVWGCGGFGGWFQVGEVQRWLRLVFFSTEERGGRRKRKKGMYVRGDPGRGKKRSVCGPSPRMGAQTRATAAPCRRAVIAAGSLLLSLEKEKVKKKIPSRYGYAEEEGGGVYRRDLSALAADRT